jgi:hypothetical protein
LRKGSFASLLRSQEIRTVQRICQFGLLVAIFAVGCAEQAKTPHVPPGDTDKKINPRAALIDTTDEPKKGNKPPATIPISDKTGDDILAALPEPTRKEMAEAQMLKAVELIAQSKYEEALQQLEEAAKTRRQRPDPTRNHQSANHHRPT